MDNNKDIVINSLDEFNYIGYFKVLKILEKEIKDCIGYDDLIELTKLYCEVYKTFNKENKED